MKSLSYELLLQVAIFTLKNDLQLTSDQLEAFKSNLEDNMQSIALKMIELQQETKSNISSGKDDQYIEH